MMNKVTRTFVRILVKLNYTDSKIFPEVVRTKS